MSFVKNLRNALEPLRDAERAAAQTAYLKGHFPFLGIPKPIQNKVCKEFFKQNSVESLEKTIRELWNCPEREFHYSALDLALFHKKKWDKKFLALFEELVRTHSWWDTVDVIAVHLIGRVIEKDPDLLTVTDLWVGDEYMWIRRSALLVQLRWKEKTDEDRLFSYCLKLSGEKEFFIRKAIGWVLRQYAKTKPAAVKEFIEKYRSSLSPLSYREASRGIDLFG